MENIMSRIAGSASGGKKILMLSAAVLFLPFFASAATLNNTFNIGTLFPAIGGNTSISSTCGPSAANSSVSLALTQNVNYTQITPNLTTDSSGAFSGNVIFPSSVSSGSAVLVATCGNTGNTINSPVLTFAAPAGTTFNLPATSPTVGGIYNLSGACGNSNGAGTTQLTLTQNGSTYNLDSISLSPTATFSDNVVIPSTINTGSATLTAACSNGTKFSSNVNIGPIAINSFTFGSSPFPGSNTAISGNCTNTSSNQNGTVSFAVLRSGTFNNLSATDNQTSSNGFFNSSVFFPASLGNQPATLVVTCPNNSTFSNVIMLGAADPVTTTPVGGVAAGTNPQTASNYFVAEVLLSMGLLGLLVITSKNLHAQK
jgi:hypothetical protein